MIDRAQVSINADYPAVEKQVLAKLEHPSPLASGLDIGPGEIGYGGASLIESVKTEDYEVAALTPSLYLCQILISASSTRPAHVCRNNPWSSPGNTDITPNSYRLPSWQKITTKTLVPRTDTVMSL